MTAWQGRRYFDSLSLNKKADLDVKAVALGVFVAVPGRKDFANPFLSTPAPEVVTAMDNVVVLDLARAMVPAVVAELAGLQAL